MYPRHLKEEVNIQVLVFSRIKSRFIGRDLKKTI